MRISKFNKTIQKELIADDRQDKHAIDKSKVRERILLPNETPDTAVAFNLDTDNFETDANFKRNNNTVGANQNVEQDLVLPASNTTVQVPETEKFDFPDINTNNTNVTVTKNNTDVTVNPNNLDVINDFTTGTNNTEPNTLPHNLNDPQPLNEQNNGVNTGNTENNANPKNSDNVGQEWVDSAIDGAKDWLGDLSGRLKEGLESLSGDTVSVIDNIKGYLNNPMGKANDLVGGLLSNLVGLINPIGGLVGGILSGKLVDVAKDLLGGLLDKVNNFLFGKEGDRTWLGNVVDGVKEWVGNVVDKVSNFLLGEEGDRTWLGKAVDWATNAYDAASKWVGNIIDTAKNFLLGEEGDRTWLGKAVDWAGNAFTDVKEWVGNALNDVKDWALGSKEDPTWLGKIFGYGYKDGETRVNQESGNVEVFDKASKSWVVKENNEYENGAEIDDGAGNIYVYDSKTDSWSLKSDNITDNKINQNGEGYGDSFTPVTENSSSDLGKVTEGGLGNNTKPTRSYHSGGSGSASGTELTQEQKWDYYNKLLASYGDKELTPQDMADLNAALAAKGIDYEKDIKNNPIGDNDQQLPEYEYQKNKDGSVTVTEYQYINGQKVKTGEKNLDKDGNTLSDLKYNLDGSLKTVTTYSTDEAGNVYEYVADGTSGKKELNSVTNKAGDKYVVKNYLNNDGSLNWDKLQQDGWGTHLIGHAAENAWADLQNGYTIDQIIKKYKPNTTNNTTGSGGSGYGGGGVSSGGSGGGYTAPCSGGYCPDGSYSPIADSSGMYGSIAQSYLGVGMHGGDTAFSMFGGGGGSWNNSYH